MFESLAPSLTPAARTSTLASTLTSTMPSRLLPLRSLPPAVATRQSAPVALRQAPSASQAPLAAADAPGTSGPISTLAPLLAAMLDEAGNGMLLVDGEAQVLYANHPARLELDDEHPLRLVLGRLVTAQAGEATALQEALAAAQRGLRRLLTLGRGEQRVRISVVPQPDPRAAEQGHAAKTAAPVALLILGKRRICGQLALHGYARAVALTPAETRVLEQLCDDVQPTKIASQQGVAVSTVRTQIGSIRAKTGARSIRDLQRQVATLPPMVGALRGSAAAYAAPGTTAMPRVALVS